MFRRLIPLGFVAGLLGAFAFAVPASANTDTAACLINGTFSTSPPVPISGGSGTYTFSSSAGTPLHLVCAGFDTANDLVGVSDLNAPSNGTYLNQVCGTGGLASFSGQTGPATVATLAGARGPGLNLGADLPTAAYRIQFVAGQGTFKWQVGSSIKSIVFGSPTDGAISIAANYDAEQVVGQCTTHFTMAGVITGTYSGTA